MEDMAGRNVQASIKLCSIWSEKGTIGREGFERCRHLLCAAMAYRSGVVTHIDAFAETRSDTSGTNLAREGPLPCALGVREALSPAG